jgi:hypothetical protein
MSIACRSNDHHLTNPTIICLSHLLYILQPSLVPLPTTEKLASLDFPLNASVIFGINITQEMI